MPQPFDRLVDNTAWAPVAHGDKALFESYFAMNEYPYRYDNHWAFICQEARLSAVRYCDEEMLLTVVSKGFESPNVIMFAPYGNQRSFVQKAPKLITELRTLIGKQVIVRRVLPKIRDLLTKGAMGFRVVHSSEFECACDIPEDVFPQVVIDTEITSRLTGTKFQRIRNHINHLQRSNRTRVEDLAEVHLSPIENVVRQWAVEHWGRMKTKQATATEVDPEAYTAFIDYLRDYPVNDADIGKVIFVNNELCGFSFVARTTESSGALYASVCLTKHRGATESLMLETVRATAQSGIRYLNLGGAETRGLFDYKKKFGDVALIETADIALDAMNSSPISATCRMTKATSNFNN